MGIGPGSRCKSSPYAAPNSNPNPKRFTIVTTLRLTGSGGKAFLLLKVNYPDAKNFEGDKVMLYEGFGSVDSLLEATGGDLDPHFADTAAAPIARFKPDVKGWAMALTFVGSL